jgi:2-phospho-L-lactate/phosphoenolpyruvate guanylyltransferase
MARRFRVVIPAKRFAAAKSRLQVDGQVRARLAACFLQDTVRAASMAQLVDQVVVLSSDPSARALATAWDVFWRDSMDSQGMNGAIRQARVGFHHDDLATAVLVADLPALRPDELDAALTTVSKAAAPGCYVADLAGVGTTLVASRGGWPTTLFGPDSALGHGAHGYRRIGDRLAGLRCDVDDVESLRMAMELGVGCSTASALAGLSLEREIA